jgi:hypothetical protein
VNAVEFFGRALLNGFGGAETDIVTSKKVRASWFVKSVVASGLLVAVESSAMSRGFTAAKHWLSPELFR